MKWYLASFYLIFLVFASVDGKGHHSKSHSRGHSHHRNEEGFIANREELKPFYNQKNIVMIASPGRSASTMLTNATKQFASSYTVLKSHLLPLDKRFQGKILFIFSNPDQAAESALHRLLHSPTHGRTHFSNVESADQEWFRHIGRNANNQNEKHNLLSYDALGCRKQLEDWLHRKTKACRPQEAQILAIKYEHLWEPKTRDAIREFLNLASFELPSKKERGYDSLELSRKEVTFKQIYNLGTDENPLYRAYDEARGLWEKAPPYQFLKL